MATLTYVGQANWDTGAGGQLSHNFGNFPTTVTATLVVMITGQWGTANTISGVTVDGVPATSQFLSPGAGSGNLNYTAIYTADVTGSATNAVVVNYGGSGVSGPSVGIFVYAVTGLAFDTPAQVAHRELQGAGASNAALTVQYVANGVAIYAAGVFCNTPSSGSTWSSATQDANIVDVNGVEWNSAHALSLTAGAHTETHTFNASTNGNGYVIICGVWSATPTPPPPPPTSETYNFDPALTDFVLNAYSLIGVKRTELLAQHLQDARLQANFILSEWANRQVNLWTVDLQSVSLTQGTATYSVPDETVAILDAYITITDSNGTPIDRLIFPVSRSDYAALPNKTTQAPPTTYWFDRLISPTITLWQVPDGGGPYTLNYYRCRQIQDALAPNGTIPELPYRWLDAFNWTLAARLAVMYAPERAQSLDARAERAWSYAAKQDTERVPIYISPGLSGYFSRW